MPALRPRTSAEVVAALLWAIIGGALIGGLFATVQTLTIFEKPWLLILGPVAIGAFSLLVVVPCTLAFSLPSIMLIHHLRLGRWSALTLCLVAAIMTQVAVVQLILGPGSTLLRDFAFTTPFATGAAIVLWWRLTCE